MAYARTAEVAAAVMTRSDGRSWNCTSMKTYSKQMIYGLLQTWAHCKTLRLGLYATNLMSNLYLLHNSSQKIRWWWWW